MEHNLNADDGDVPDNIDLSAEHKSFSDYLDKLCVYWMHYGVPYDVFWNGDYTQLKYYAEAYKLDMERKNHEMWLQGAYIYDAFSVVTSKTWSKNSQAKYPDKPYRITEMSEDERAIENKRMVDDFRKKLNQIGSRLERKHNMCSAVVAESSK